jgi:hypothetical protein
MPAEPQSIQAAAMGELPELTGRVQGHFNDPRRPLSGASSHNKDRLTLADMLNGNTYNQWLTAQDIESCVEVENAAFPEGQRATREKV